MTQNGHDQPAVTAAPAVWLRIGDENVRSDQIIRWRDDYYNGWQHYLTVSLSTGKEVSAEVTREQWSAFKAAVDGG
jgi:hypothetical protein